VVVTVATHDLARGVFVGVLRIDRSSDASGLVRTYSVVGQVIFASSKSFITRFDDKEVVNQVCIDVSRAHFRDITAISTLDKARQGQCR
jgi:SulP family sulfate permease